MKIKTIEKKGYKLHLIENPNFKTILVKAIFWEKIKKEEITIRNMLINNLLFSSASYRTEKELSIKKEELYGANLGGGNYRKSNYIISEINLAYIEDKYSDKNQTKNVLEFFFDVLLNPNVENNEFYKPSFDICYEMIKSDIKSEKESPGYFSNKEYKKIIGKDKPFSLSIVGTLEELKKVTPENLYTYYKEFLKNNNIDIFVIGNIKKYKIEEYFKDLEETINDYSKDDLYIDYEKEFSETKIKTKFYQSRLIMGSSLKNFTRHEKKYELLLFNIIFGSSPNSKLFKVVREKYSYAYSVNSSINRLDGIFQISAGISKQNYEGAKKEVLLQLDEMKKGNFTEQDLKDAKAVVLGLIREINDYQSSIIDHTFNSMYFDHDKEDIRIEEIMNVTKDDIIKVSNKIHIDTIFLAEEKDNETD